MTNSCDTCKFFHQEPGDVESPTGACRRYPPSQMYMPTMGRQVIGAKPTINWDEQASAFPLTLKSSLCGEFQASDHSAILRQ